MISVYKSAHYKNTNKLVNPPDESIVYHPIVGIDLLFQGFMSASEAKIEDLPVYSYSELKGRFKDLINHKAAQIQKNKKDSDSFIKEGKKDYDSFIKEGNDYDSFIKEGKKDQVQEVEIEHKSTEGAGTFHEHLSDTEPTKSKEIEKAKKG